MADLKTNLLGFAMNSPIIGASGTVGYGVEYEELADFTKIGGISGKGLTLHGQYGNKGERLWETLRPHQQHRPAEPRRAALHRRGTERDAGAEAEIRHGGHREPGRPQ